ncbi:DNA polymerase IV [Priestia filamentosa]|uniref:DNA polymerase IV n=1 Tax=Priestia filamentosa TaxID=1402861 RepID=UPI0039799EE7
MYPKKGKVILHVDANAFFASVEIAQDPSLKDKPVVVAGNPNERKGMVIAANYICKNKGIYTTMPLREARKLCPDMVVKKPNHDLYRDVSSRMFDFFTTITPKVEVASIDEAYLDISECQELGSPPDIAKHIQNSLLENLNIPVSIGIAPNKFLAKMASDMKKPLGITVLRKREIQDVLWDKPVGEAHGVGKKTEEKLINFGIHTIGDLAKADTISLEKLLGINGLKLHQRVNGNDNREVDPKANITYKTIGNSSTLPKDTTDDKVLSSLIHRLASSVSNRMKRKRVVSQRIQITIRYDDFKTITRSRNTDAFFEEADDIYNYAMRLFNKHWNGNAVRLIGITALDVVNKNQMTKQLDIFSYQEEADKYEPIQKTIDALERKFGSDVIKRGADIEPQEKQPKIPFH